MKTVVALWHTSDKGKTETLREFGKELLIAYPAHISIYPSPTVIPATGDFRLVVEINGKIVGIESQGDPGTKLQNRLLELSDNYHCDIILTSSRTKGETVNAVEYLYNHRNFQTIWTSTYQMATGHHFANNYKAKHLIDLLQQLRLI